MTKKILITVIVLLSLTFFYEVVLAFSTGIGGRTRKQINEPEIGCSCHKIIAVPSVVVTISGPTQVAPNSSNVYRITMRGTPAIKGGFDFNVGHGDVDTVGGQMTQNFGLDITHSQPKNYTADSVSWLVRYIAPNTLGFDTLFATGNSVNGNDIADSLDQWNFSNDFIVNVQPIGIKQISTVATGYSLGQNYPNPFNPKTVIRFQLSVNSFTSLKVYDLLGREVASLVNEQLQPGTYEVDWDASNYPSGVYFYKIVAGDFVETKKMILIK